MTAKWGCTHLHTNLKGKIKKVAGREVFVESEKEISDDDLKALRKLSRELDSGESPYYCIVSVLMLREGWDVRNVTTIVPLRPYTSKAGILPEQTLGRGLRRMVPSGQVNEVVAVIEHEAFARLYREELAQEGLPIEIVDVDKVPTTTVSIFPDTANKDAAALDIAIPSLSAGAQTLPVLGPITEEEVREAFKPLRPLPLGEKATRDVQYEGRHLITNEVVENMKVNLSLLESGVGAISFFERELEYVCKVKNTHQVLGPLLQTFFEKLLFESEGSLFDPARAARFSDSDVREHVRAVFVPLIRRKTTQQQVRAAQAPPVTVTSWRPFQVTVSERRPVHQSPRTVFNLVPCNRALESAFTEHCSRANDVAAFAKNAGPQCLRIDYLSDGMRLAFYTPDFLVRTTDGRHYLAETKGRVDRDVPAKARAAVEWCKSASTKQVTWHYLYVVEEIFQRYHGDSMADLARTCEPALHALIHAREAAEEMPLFAGKEGEWERMGEAQGIIDQKVLDALPERLQKAANEAISLYRFFEKKPDVNYAPVFTALLGVVDELAKRTIVQKLSPAMPANMVEQRRWFEPHFGGVDPRTVRHYEEVARNLRKTLVYQSGVSPLGLLRNCLDYALNDNSKLTGVFEAVRTAYRFKGSRDLLDTVKSINEFRNTRVAHQEVKLNAPAEARAALAQWIHGMSHLWHVGEVLKSSP